MLSDEDSSILVKFCRNLKKFHCNEHEMEKQLFQGHPAYQVL